jgi:N-acetylglucosamine-6-phosphate deacetylase
MPSVGSDEPRFVLQGREIWRDGDTLHGADGVLAGSTLTMSGAVKGMVERGRVPLAAAVTMASATPAAFLGLSGQTGTIAAGMRADLVLLDDDYAVRETWIGGEPSGAAQPVAAVAK